MLTPPSKHRLIHLVGTVPLSSTEEVFEKVGPKLSPFMKRLPDGETGVRHYWITSQARNLHYNPNFEPAGHNWTPESGSPPETGAPKYRLRKGVDPKTVKLESFGYGEFARQSYAEFKKAKADGRIAPQTRFQVCLPTPMAFYVGIVAPESQEAAAPIMEARMAEDLKDVLAVVPHDDLAIQWDACLEIFVWEGVRTIFFPDAKQGIIDRLAALGDLVPQPAEVGFHFCYGDFKHAHAVEPKDTQNMVTMANAIAAQMHRPVNFFHFPVPRDRNDAAYFKPLNNLTIDAATDIFLGLVHHTDDVAGTQKRIAAAEATLSRPFGIATECGWGRRDKATIPRLMDIHVACASAHD
ncbi:MAG: hypothetical protein KIT48_09550 [Pseudolabrys sp.]|nr:hypothetical protein [Pseudolabrys sp.]